MRGQDACQGAPISQEKRKDYRIKQRCDHASAKVRIFQRMLRRRLSMLYAGASPSMGTKLHEKTQPGAALVYVAGEGTA